MTSLFDTPENGEKKRSIFDSEWTQPETSPEVELNVRLSPLAPLVLAGAVLSLFRLVWPHFVLTALSVLTLILGILTLWLIARSEKTLTGSRFVLIGLFILIAQMSAVSVSDAFYRQQIIKQGRTFARLVTDAAQKGDTTSLELLSHTSIDRQEVKDEKAYWLSVVSRYKENHEYLHTSLLNQPVLLTLCGLGDQVKIRYYRTMPIVRINDHQETVPMIFSATYGNSEGKPESFLFAVLLDHYKAAGKDNIGLWKWTSFAEYPGQKKE